MKYVLTEIANPHHRRMRRLLKDLGISSEQLFQIKAQFDRDFYLQSYPDVAESDLDPLFHYLKYGWKEGRDPSLSFSTRFYMCANPDLRNGDTHPFVHYCIHGQAEGRAPCPRYITDFHELTTQERKKIRDKFDPEFYFDQNIDVANSNWEPFQHYMRFGWIERRDPSPRFSTGYYLDTYPDIAEANMNPFIHYYLHGQIEGRLAKDTCNNTSEKKTYAPPDNIALECTFADPEEINWISSEFNRAFYKSKYPNSVLPGITPEAHYLMVGWKLNYDPSPDFSTSYYSRRYPDILRSGINPLVHYCRYGKAERRETSSFIDRNRASKQPLVSAIIPNFNHAPYLRKRILSIANQTYKNIELIILDDCSTDNSRQVISEIVKEFNLDARLVFNETNSGNVSFQWQKAVDLARGELIWICESDDFCEPDFVEHLVPAFADNSVTIAFGRIQFCDSDGEFMEGLDNYREGAEPGIWSKNTKRPAAEWFRNGFGVNNVIANVGGCIFRKVILPDEIWATARTFRICADWYLYINIAGAGQIVFEPNAITYFRQHATNTSSTNFHNLYYYKENMRVLQELADTWNIPVETREKFLGKVEAQWKHYGMAESHGNFDTCLNTEKYLCEGKQKPHIQIYFYGFNPGGGELFPINLANALLDAGYIVSMVAMDLSKVNEDMRQRVNLRIPVYHAIHLAERGRAAFLDACGVSVLHSHVVSCDTFLMDLSPSKIERPFVVTLHGSYVGLQEAPRQIVDRLLENVSTWVYTADRNLEFFEERGIDHSEFVKLPNAMPPDPRQAAFTRAELGIPEDGVVFAFVARGVMRKGWRALVEAHRLLRSWGETNTYLLMVGDGEATEEARERADGLDGVFFLGYQSEINGIFKLSDVAVLPTRFEGESFPLILIQALQEHLPIIATDIGEISSIITSDCNITAGRLLKNDRNTDVFTENLAQAMLEMTAAEARKSATIAAAMCAERFSMEKLIENYGNIYSAATNDRAEHIALAREAFISQFG